MANVYAANAMCAKLQKENTALRAALERIAVWLVAPDLSQETLDEMSGIARAALAVKEFSVTNIDANTVRVTGLFHDVAANTRPRLTYLITLVDANGATTGTNVKFEKVIE